MHRSVTKSAGSRHSRTSVMISDDSRAVREEFRSVLAGVPGVERVETAGSGEEVLARYPGERPDLVLMAMHMPGIGGMEATRRLVLRYPDANVLMLTVAGDRNSIGMAVSGGARGYLVKDASHEDLCAAVAHALAGPELRRSVLRSAPRAAADAPALTSRELQVLRGMSQGKSNGAIGRELFVSEDTVKTHAQRLFRKLGVNDRANAVALGFRLRLVR
jgi:DNA-binding NarL/FixJ family response regulator